MSYIYLLVPFVSVVIAQISKFFIKKNHLQWSWKNLIAYAGMPSSHSAVTVSLATITALRLGLDSPIFALSVLIAFLSIRDAAGIRQYIGRQGKVINELVEDLDEGAYLDDVYPELIEKVGHTPRQIIAGAIIGFLVAVALNF